ncbi:DNA-directed RNA polymerase III subunit RPC1 [Astathelohania contejeani]|uniref:DNA-directed RNA polymerase subunit n=1 Tax=Astathelohania contejeani TaxID=164912 RepID=A0ABQ7HXK7_9MICR|nr:DNA-directed RNA polymerase III subunit RPC1 [Thelohania contejeani]
MKKELNPHFNLPKQISEIQFGILSKKEITAMSVLSVTRREMYDPESRRPMMGGPLDPRLGTSNKSEKCETCHESILRCSGHFGDIELTLPVFHIGFLRHTLQILHCICKNCAAVLISPSRKTYYDIRKLVEECKKISVCHNCKAHNGTVKKGQGFRIYHYLPNTTEDLNPLTVLNLFKMIAPKDWKILSLSFPPENLIIQKLLVPPACIRPSVMLDQEDGSNEDDLTIKLCEIIHTNQVIKEKMHNLSILIEDWDFLQLQVGLFINSDLPGVTTPNSVNRPIRGLIQRLKGKGGRFRENLSGKRVDFSGRTVISPDPNLSVEEVGMPKAMAQILTFPEPVTAFNRARLQEMVRRGPESYPGANYIFNPQTESKRYLRFGDREALASTLLDGDIVERHLIDGDTVLFNRQPSLHRLSVMAHRVRVMPWRTLRFNECVCTPYNADFDGDEMNIHVPQTYEARAEASVLMGVKHNLVTPRNGEPLVAATQDFITGLYLLTSKDVFFTREEFGQVISHFIGKDERVLIEPSVIRPYELFTGKQVVEVLIRDAINNGIKMNEFDEHKFNNSCINTNNMGSSNIKDVSDDKIFIVRNNFYLFGRIDKSIVGAEKKDKSILYALMLISENCAVRAMNSIARLIPRFLSGRGFSIGYDDVLPDHKLREGKAKILKEGYSSVTRMISNHALGKITAQPGCTTEETLELSISAELSNIREKCGTLCVNSLSINNAPLIMQACGSKGSKINISQMIACVGQQIISGHRIPDGFEKRPLPHFPRCSLMPAAKGFVEASFCSGLSPTEFFFHAVSGREGLVDTAVKTAETGYMQRRLMKALEDLCVEYDYSVRNANGEVVQFVYGEDKIDPINNTHWIDPGTAVGAIAGQSIGEPGTQMTLKTFHFAGVASMNITLGVPRLKEIINASKAISTPIINAKIEKETKCKIEKIKNKIERILLSDIWESITELYGIHECCLEIIINTEIANDLDITMDTIRDRICKIKRIPKEHIQIHNSVLQIYIKKYKKEPESIYFILQKVKRSLGSIIVSGIETVGKVVVSKNGDEYELGIEGTGLAKVLGVEGIDSNHTRSNNSMEILEVLGIEAARQSIIDEILYTMEKHGIKLDSRHVMLLADTMCYKGEVLGITRFGISKMKMSTLMLASFEQTSDHLFEAAIGGKRDVIEGVSESIILGMNVGVGTGRIELYHSK